MKNNPTHTGDSTQSTTSLPAMKQLANQLTQQQRFAEATQAFENICAAFPDDAESWFMLGALYGQLQNFSEAERCCKKALLAAPQHPGLQYNLAIALSKQNKLEEAVTHFKQAIQIKPDFTEAYRDLGSTQQALNLFSDAILSFRSAIRFRPDAAELYFSLGRAQHKDDLLNEAIVSHEAAVRLQPDFLDACSELAALLIVKYKFTKAIQLLETAIKILPNAHDLHFKLGTAYQKTGDLDKSARSYQKALSLCPDHQDTQSGIAAVLGLQAKYDEAYAILRPILDSDQCNGTALAIFAHFAHHFGHEDEAITRLERYLAKEHITDFIKAKLLFSLANLKARKQDYDTAFQIYTQANQTANMTFDTAEFTWVVDSLCKTYCAAEFPGLPCSGLNTQTPVFIIGMPRSGTSLVEQILASHPKVFGAGELSIINDLVAKLPVRFSTRSAYPDCIRELSTGNLAEMAGDYLQTIETLSDSHLVVTDKMPGNFIHLGLINLLFPNSRIIYCTREPMDNCLSCYFQDFSGAHPYAYNLEDLAFYYRLHEKLMAHWHDVLSLPILEIKYEDMVGNQEASSRKLVEFCGLGWDERCLQFHNTKRTVSTASNEQVRQPIYTSSIERWKHYEQHLEPLISSLKTGN